MGTTHKKRGSIDLPIGRPVKGVLSSFSPLIAQYIDKYRPSKEGWSAQTISVELGLEDSLSDKNKPTVSSIGRYLCSKKRTKRYRKPFHQEPSAFIKTTQAHEVWQIDAEGTKNILGVGWVSPINVKDIETKIFVVTYPCCVKTVNNLPHGSVFFDNKSTSPFPTTLYLWLLGLGIEILFTPVGKPQKQGMVERSHQTLHGQLTPGIALTNFNDLFDFFQQRRQRLNEHIPSCANQKLPPLVNRPDARMPLRAYEILNEANLFDKNKIHQYLQNQTWFRLVALNKNFSIGGQIYHLPSAKPNSQILVKYNKALEGFDCFEPNGKLLDFCPAKKLNFNELAGDINQFNSWVISRLLLKHD